MQRHPGWERRRNWLVLLLQEKGKPLMLGLMASERERLQQEGWCQAIDYILNRDTQIDEAWADLQRTGQEAGKEELEGGDYGVNYEAAQ